MREEVPQVRVEGGWAAELVALRADLMRQYVALGTKLAEVEKELVSMLNGRPGELLVNGVPVVTNAPIKAYAWAKFSQDHPDLARLYTKRQERRVLDTDAVLLNVEPELLAQYRTWRTTFAGGSR